MIETVFSTIQLAPEFMKFELKVSMVEIYMEKIKDLID